MAILHFTGEDVRQLLLPQLTEDYPGQVSVGWEAADDCEGIACGERIEAGFSPEKLALWHEWNADRGPMPRHSHMSVRGVDRETRPSIFAVLKIGEETL